MTTVERRDQPDDAVGSAAPGIAGDCRGMNFWRSDPALRALLASYLPADVLAHAEPHLDRLGELAGGRLDELAATADRNPPVLRTRDRFGRDEDWIDYHPAYREMERIAFTDFGLHAMSHRAGVLAWPAPVPASVKYALQYLFAQAEFGLLCPVSLTDTASHVIARFGSPALRDHLLPRLLSQDPATMWKAAQFMTEKTGGSDVGTASTVAEPIGVDASGLDRWRLTGDKWFCSHADGDVALVLARPVGAPAGTKGLALFALPRRLPDGRRNAYRIARLKDKLGTRSMASGEIVLDGAEAYLVGDVERGLAQMLDQVNLSRLSHGVRAAGMMRRCLNEALLVARDRVAFGRPLVEHPLMRRQLMKLMLPTEQALSMTAYAAHLVDADADDILRILTPLVKYRACRDNVEVASGSLEVRGGNGYIEDWVNSRLLRDAQLGTVWEGTSSIVALDVVTRAAGRAGAHDVLAADLHRRLDAAGGVPPGLGAELARLLDRAVAFVAGVAADPQDEPACRTAAGALYHAASAVLLAVEGADAGEAGGDARRLLLARLVADHRLRPRDPLADPRSRVDDEIVSRLLADADVPLELARALADAAG